MSRRRSSSTKAKRIAKGWGSSPPFFVVVGDGEMEPFWLAVASGLFRLASASPCGIIAGRWKVAGSHSLHCRSPHGVLDLERNGIMQNDRIRLQKYLSECSVASRRKAEELIEQGKVKINGRIAILGDKVSPREDVVTVAGRRIRREKGSRYYLMLYKPRGFVTTMHDEMGRRCVADLLDDVPVRVYPVGRLDRDSEGLLLCTNDGDFANRMMHPSGHVPKTYRVTVRPPVSAQQLDALRAGVVIDGRPTAPCEVDPLVEEDARVVLRVVLQEGRNRQIRKMCEAVGLEVTRLKRTAVGSLTLGMLPQGKWRELTEQEVRSLISESKHALPPGQKGGLRKNLR